MGAEFPDLRVASWPRRYCIMGLDVGLDLGSVHSIWEGLCVLRLPGVRNTVSVNGNIAHVHSYQGRWLSSVRNKCYYGGAPRYFVHVEHSHEMTPDQSSYTNKKWAW